MLFSEIHWYDYGARMYDPVIGRWHVQDLMAENHYDLTPYDFVGGNPINRIDILGLDWFHNDNLGYQWFESFKKTHTDDNGNEYTNKGHTYSYQDEDGNWWNYYQNYGLKTKNKIEDMQSFLTSSAYWYGRSRGMLEEKYYNELYTDAWAADRNKSSRAVLSWIAGVTGGVIGASEVAALIPAAYEGSNAAIMNHLVNMEINTGNVSFLMDMKYIIGTSVLYPYLLALVKELNTSTPPSGMTKQQYKLKLIRTLLQLKGDSRKENEKLINQN